MPPPTLMVVNCKSAGNYTVHKLLNGTTLDPSQDGDTIPDSKFSTSSDWERTNQLVEFLGKRYLVTTVGIRERDAGGDGNWGLVYTPNQTIGQSGLAQSGLHVGYSKSGTAYMVWWYGSTSNSVRAVTTSDGVNYSETEAMSSISTADYAGRAFIFGDLAFWAVAEANDGDLICYYNLTTGSTKQWTTTTIDTITLPASGVRQNDFTVLNDTLFMTLLNSSNHPMLYRFESDNWINPRGDGVTIVGLSHAVQGRIAIFPNPSNDSLIALLPRTTGQPARAYEITNVLTGQSAAASNVSVATTFETLFPAGNSYAFTKYVDTTAPASPVVYFWSQDGGTDAGTYDCYQWNGTGSAVTLVGSGVTGSNHALPHSDTGGQDRIPSAPAARPHFVDLPTQTVGGRRRYFRVYGTGADLTLQQAHSADQHAPSTVSTLVASSIQLEDNIDVTGLVGNANESTLEGLSPSAGDAYVLTALDGDRTLTPGGLTGLIPGDIVQYNGSAWTLARQSVNVDDSLLAYWKFDGDGTDRGPVGDDLSLTGSVPFVSGLFDQAADFPGTNGNYWDVAAADADLDFNQGFKPFTISLWVNTDTVASSALLNKGSFGTSGWDLEFNGSGDLTFAGSGGGDPPSATAAAAISAGAGWQHVVVVCYGSYDIEIFVDGSSAATDTGTTAWTSGESVPLRFGNSSTNVLPFDGQMDDVAIWSRSLSSAEITALYNSGNGRELGVPDFGTHATLNSTTALISPYTDGTDDGKTASFNGKSLNGTALTAPSNTTSQIVVTPDDGASLWSYVHDTSTDSLSAGDVHTVMLDPV